MDLSASVDVILVVYGLKKVLLSGGKGKKVENNVRDREENIGRQADTL